jgi:hypothetical protein
LLLEYRLRPRPHGPCVPSALLQPIDPRIGLREISPRPLASPTRHRSPLRRASANPWSTAPSALPAGKYHETSTTYNRKTL